MIGRVDILAYFLRMLYYCAVSGFIGPMRQFLPQTYQFSYHVWLVSYIGIREELEWETLKQKLWDVPSVYIPCYRYITCQITIKWCRENGVVYQIIV